MTLFINLSNFYHFSNRIEYIKGLIKLKINNKKEKEIISDSEKNNLNESIDFLRCCICMDEKNDIMLKCSVIYYHLIILN
jgi:hypothetical protein